MRVSCILRLAALFSLPLAAFSIIRTTCQRLGTLLILHCDCEWRGGVAAGYWNAKTATLKA